MEEIRNKLHTEIENLMKECRIESEEDYQEWIAEAITIMGGMKFIKLLRKKAQLDLLDKLSREKQTKMYEAILKKNKRKHEERLRDIN